MFASLKRKPSTSYFPLLCFLHPSVAIYSLNGVCLPDLPGMKCHISVWSLSLNHFLCLPWFPKPFWLPLPPWTWLFDVSPTVRDAGGGIFVLCVCVCMHFQVCFCLKLTRATEVIKMWWRRPLERIGAVHLLWLCILWNKRMFVLCFQRYSFAWLEIFSWEFGFYSKNLHYSICYFSRSLLT